MAVGAAGAGGVEEAGRRTHLRNCYERVLRLVDLTVRVHHRPTLWKELLRWRDLIAQLYIAPESSLDEHDDAFRCLLRFTPVAYQQLPLVLGPGSRVTAVT